MEQLGACIGTSKKPMAFRPSPKTAEIIKDEETQHPKWKRGRIINTLIESSRAEPKTEGTSKSPFTLVPLNGYCPNDRTFYMMETLIEMCPKCRSKKTCPAWRDHGS